MKNLLFGTDSNTAGATAHNPNTESNQSDIVLAQLSQVKIDDSKEYSSEYAIISFRIDMIFLINYFFFHYVTGNVQLRTFVAFTSKPSSHRF